MFHTFNPSDKTWISRHPAPVFDPQTNLGQLILNALERHPAGKVLQIDADSGKELTSREMRLRAIRVAQNLASLGFRRGDMAAIACSNSENLAPIVLGLWISGLPFISLPVAFNAEDLGHLLGLVQPKLVICDDGVVYKTVLDGAGQTLKIKPVIFVAESELESVRRVEELLQETGTEEEFVNAKTLDPSGGYWAEALPAMETPLCAVVDPVRDFRWHALRCGGPETAAFLCELPVPTWATDCTITSMPSLTVQYMSDSGAVQLSRDCGEQGTKHMSCQGKLDRDTILQQLQCGNEELDPILAGSSAPENNLLPVEQPAEVTRRPSLPPQLLEHDILTVVSNNDEDNNIDVNPNQIEDTVKNVINKFNLADLMQADQALHSEEMDGEEGKEGKKVGGKKYSPLFEKKDSFGKKGGKKVDDEEEIMMGDQPDETETQPIDIVQQAVKPTEGESDESSTAGTAGSSTEGSAATSSEETLTESTTVDSRLRRATEGEASDSTAVSTTESSTVEPSTTTTTTMEPTTSSTASHILPTTPKKELASVGDHFIPPMLMVKARFTSTKAHSETVAPSTTELITETAEPSPSSSAVPPSTTEDLLTTAILSEESYAVSENGSDVQILELRDNTLSTETSTATSESSVSSTIAHQIVEITFDDKELTSKIGTLSITTRPFTVAETHNASTPQDTTQSSSTVVYTTTPSLPSSTSTSIPVTETSPSSTVTSTTLLPSTSTSRTSPTTLKPTTVELHESQEHFEDLLDHEHQEQEEQVEDDDEHHEDQEHPEDQHKELHNSFSNVENFQPYKPNRHRSLTKPEVHNNRGNYIKKILG